MRQTRAHQGAAIVCSILNIENLTIALGCYNMPAQILPQIDEKSLVEEPIARRNNICVSVPCIQTTLVIASVMRVDFIHVGSLSFLFSLHANVLPRLTDQSQFVRMPKSLHGCDSDIS